MAFHYQHTNLDTLTASGGLSVTGASGTGRVLARSTGSLRLEHAVLGRSRPAAERLPLRRPRDYRRESAKLLGTFILTLRGTPYVYQGQELGMTNADWETMDDLRDVDAINHARELLDRDGVEEYDDVKDIVGYRTRDNARTSINGTTRRTPGSPTATPDQAVRLRETTSGDQQADLDSVYSYYQRLIQCAPTGTCWCTRTTPTCSPTTKLSSPSHGRCRRTRAPSDPRRRAFRRRNGDPRRPGRVRRCDAARGQLRL